jgi:DNA-binding winged helix-turn-helix (wHTH) protein
MTARPPIDHESDWFRPLLDSAPDVYFRYALSPARRFVYLSPSVSVLTGHPPDDFYEDPTLCVGLVAREDRRVLRQVLRARRGLSLTLRLNRNGALVPLELRTVAVVRDRKVVAIEGLVRLSVSSTSASGQSGPDAEPIQQRLASLMYQVHDLLHRVLPPATTPASGSQLKLGSLALDLERLTVTDAGTPVSLTSREVLVLRYLLQRTGRVVTRQQLLADVWGYSYTGDDRTVDVHISRLRRKLPSLKTHLVAIKHVGYRLDDEPAARIANF